MYLCGIDSLAALLAPSQVSDAVSVALRHLWGSSPPKVQMPFAAILFALARLGASPSILQGLGFITEGPQKNRITHEILLEALKRLLAIVKAAGLSVKPMLNPITYLLIKCIPS